MTRIVPYTSSWLFAMMLAGAPILAQEVEFQAPEYARLVESATSAAPVSISADATVVDWDMNLIREGTNDWTCLPDRPDTSENDPACLNRAGLNWYKAYMGKLDPQYEGLGIVYRLQEGPTVSNTDPYATQPTAETDWVEEIGPHLMVLVPDALKLDNLSTNPRSGEPWVMWADTPYEHVRIPLVDAPATFEKEHPIQQLGPTVELTLFQMSHGSDSLLAKARNVLEKHGFSVTREDPVRLLLDARRSDSDHTSYDRIVVWLEPHWAYPDRYYQFFFQYGRYELLRGRGVRRVIVDSEGSTIEALRKALAWMYGNKGKL